MARLDADTLIPSLQRTHRVDVATDGAARSDDAVAGILVPSTGAIPADLGVGRAALDAAGFSGKVGETLVLPANDEQPMVAVGIGDPTELTPAAVRDAGAAFARAAAGHEDLRIALPTGGELDPAGTAQALVEGMLLARYRYEALKRTPTTTPIASMTLLVSDDDRAEAEVGARRGRIFAAATSLARDLANAPAVMLTAERMAEVATGIADACGLTVTVYDRDQLIEMGCGGLLGVNAGSTDEPRMIRLDYQPERAGTHLTLVGKGIMYDSGGISLKPGDESHSQMKNDMSGAAAILAAMAALNELHGPVAVTGYLMCTDNMPSGSATKLGDVLTIRGGTTVEVLNTDAEGRLVMADALALATESHTDAIVDIATLTGACLRALGPGVAGVIGTNQGLIDGILRSAGGTGEPVWQLPLDRRYRSWLDSSIADIKNIGGDSAGAITAALFLAEFAGSVPWAHLDIAGTAWQKVSTGWRPDGCTGFGARLLLDFALGFDPGRLSTAPTLQDYALTGMNAH